MVGVAQLVEPWIVIPVVVGSSPITHPKFMVQCRSLLQRRLTGYTVLLRSKIMGL